MTITTGVPATGGGTTAPPGQRSGVELFRGFVYQSTHLADIFITARIENRTYESDESVRPFLGLVFPTFIRRAAEEFPVSHREGLEAGKLAIKVDAVVCLVFDGRCKSNHLIPPFQAGKVQVLGSQFGFAAARFENPLGQSDRFQSGKGDIERLVSGYELVEQRGHGTPPKMGL